MEPINIVWALLDASQGKLWKKLGTNHAQWHPPWEHRAVVVLGGLREEKGLASLGPFLGASSGRALSSSGQCLGSTAVVPASGFGGFWMNFTHFFGFRAVPALVCWVAFCVPLVLGRLASCALCLPALRISQSLVRCLSVA